MAAPEPNQATKNVGAPACRPCPGKSTPDTPHDAPKPNGLPAPAIPTAPLSAKPGTARPLAPDRYAIRFTASKELLDKVERVRDLISHKMPHADIAEVIDQALEVYVAHLEKKRFAVGSPKTQTSVAIQEETPLSSERERRKRIATTNPRQLGLGMCRTISNGRSTKGTAVVAAMLGLMGESAEPPEISNSII